MPLIELFNTIFSKFKKAENIKTVTIEMDVESLEQEYATQINFIKDKLTSAYYYTKQLQSNVIKNKFFKTILVGYGVYEELKNKKTPPSEYLKHYTETLNSLIEKYLSLKEKEKNELLDKKDIFEDIENSLSDITKGFKQEINKIMSNDLTETNIAIKLIKELTKIKEPPKQ